MKSFAANEDGTESFDAIEEWALESDPLSEEMTPEELEALEKWALEDDSPSDASLPEEIPEPEVQDGIPEMEETPVQESDVMEEEEKPEQTSVSEEMTVEEAPSEEEAEQAEKSEQTEEAEQAEKSEQTEEAEQTADTGEAAELVTPDGWALDEDILAGELNVKEEAVLDDIFGETGSALDDFMAGAEEADKPGKEEPEQEDLAADFNLSDLELENFELSGDSEDTAADDTMSEEDIDRLLSDDFALEETGDDDEGLSALLESMGQDDDLSAISDLLEKADQGMMEDDDMLALLEENSAENAEDGDDAFDFWGKDETTEIRSGSIQRNTEEGLDELVPNKEENKKEKKKKEKRKKKADKEGRAGEDRAEKPEKQGFFSKIMSALLEDEEDFSEGAGSGGVAGELGSLSEENQELLEELNAEDKKKGKKEKKKKEPKKKAKDDKKAKKAPKPKKPKKEKKVRNVEPEAPGKRISRTKIVFVVLFCGSVAAAIIVVNMFIPDYMQKQEAREMYTASQYEKVYDLLYGKELNEEEDALFRKSNIILQVQRKWNSYENYSKLGMSGEALNALIEGVDFYHLFIADAQQYGVSGEIDGIYARILAELSGVYGVSEEDALNVIASENDLDYSEKLYSILSGNGIGAPEEEEQPKEKQDVLPEEEEIIDRLENADSPAGEPDAGVEGADVPAEETGNETGDAEA